MVAILAMLFVPACGSFCAAMTHCSTENVSASAESCHHSDVSGQADSESSLSSQASCIQQPAQLAVLAGNESSTDARFSGSSNVSVSLDVPSFAVTIGSCSNNSVPVAESPQQSIPLEKLSILRV
jgi:hypothetical protein